MLLSLINCRFIIIIIIIIIITNTILIILWESTDQISCSLQSKDNIGLDNTMPLMRLGPSGQNPTESESILPQSSDKSKHGKKAVTMAITTARNVMLTLLQ